MGNADFGELGQVNCYDKDRFVWHFARYNVKQGAFCAGIDNAACSRAGALHALLPTPVDSSDVHQWGVAVALDIESASVLEAGSEHVSQLRILGDHGPKLGRVENFSGEIRATAPAKLVDGNLEYSPNREKQRHCGIKNTHG